MSRKKKSIFLAALVLLTVLSAAMGVTFAYLTRNLESRANNFTFSNASIDLTESGWDKLSSDQKTVYPGRSVTKDPVIENTGANDIYVYIEVKIPRASIRTVNEDETVASEAVQNLLTFEVNSGWELMESSVEGGYSVERYAYTAGVLKPGASTVSLFKNNKVEFVNMLEGELEKGYQFDMPIAAYAIQADNVKVMGSTTLEKMLSAFNTYSSQQAQN